MTLLSVQLYLLNRMSSTEPHVIYWTACHLPENRNVIMASQCEWKMRNLNFYEASNIENCANGSSTDIGHIHNDTQAWGMICHKSFFKIPFR